MMRLPSAILVLSLVCGLVAMGGSAAAEVLSQSCMTHRLYKAGFPHIKAVKYEQNMISSELTEKYILDIPAAVLRFLIRSDLDDARAIQDCIAKRSDQCSKYEPCHNGGECQLKEQKNTYACACHADFTGKFCKTPHPAPVRELRNLEKQFREFKEATEQRRTITDGRLHAAEEKLKASERRLHAAEEKLKFHGTGCSSISLGYKYRTRYYSQTVATSGSIASLTFRKKFDSTVLRFTYSNTIAVRTAQKTGRWYIKIDGHECRKPTKVDIAMYNENGDDHFIPSVLFGICEKTDAGRIGKGDHMITVNVGAAHGHRLDHNLNSRHLASSILEVQEMCPQF